MSDTSRRRFLQTTAASVAALGLPRAAFPVERATLRAEIARRHDQDVKRLQDWIRLPSIAAEDRSMSEGCELMMQLLKDAGFQAVTRVPTDRHPGVFATLDARKPRTLGVYFM